MSAEELELQVLELNDTVELLTLDKEQLLIDKEILEERVLQLQEDLVKAQQATSHGGHSSATTSTVSVKESAEYKTLHEENDKLREALMRLNTITTQVKDENKELQHKVQGMTGEVEALRAYKASNEAEVEALRQSVDSMSSFESMIEKLSNDNLELSSKVQELQQTIQELEETLELNEALDHSQRQQIDEDKQTIQRIQIQLNQYEQKLQEKELNILEQHRKSDQMKELITSQKKELDRLQTLLSTEFQENQEIANKLQDAITLRVQYETLQQSQMKWKLQHFQMLQDKYKYQVLSQRYDCMFGNQTASVMLMEELKGLNSEVMAMTALTSSFEVQKVVAEVLQVLLALPNDSSNGASSGTVGVASMELLRQIHEVFATMSQLLLLQDSLLLPLIILNIKDSMDVKQYHWNVSWLVRVKEVFQRSHGVVVNASIATKDFLLANQQTNDLTEAQQSALDLRKIQVEEYKNTLWTIVEEIQAGFVDLLVLPGTLEEDKKWSWKKMAASVKQFFHTNMSSDLHSHICLETLLVLVSNVIESYLFRSVTSSSHVLIKSVKVEVDLLLKNVRRLLALSSGSSKEAASLLLEILLALADSEGNVAFASLAQEDDVVVSATNEESWKALLANIRKLGSLAQVHDVSNVSGNNTVVLRYLPVTTLLSNAKGRDEKAMEEQHQLLQEKFWSLLHAGQGQDLLMTTSTQDMTDSNAGSGSVDAAWKVRLVQIRQFIHTKLSVEGSSNTTQANQSVGSLTPTKGENPNNTSSFNEQTVSKQQYQQLLQQLDIKRDELKSALNRCEELQAAYEQATTSHSSHPSTRSTTPKLGAGLTKLSPANSMQDFSSISNTDANGLTPEEASKLKKDMKALEEAFATIELKAEQLNKENKTLKTQVVSLGGTVEAPAASASSAGNTAAASKDRPVVARRRSQVDISEGAKTTAGAASTTGSKSSVENDLLSLLNSVPSAKGRAASSSSTAPLTSSSAAATSSSNPTSVTAANYQLMQEKTTILTEQMNHWRRVAMKRLATSLLPLENPSLLSASGTDKVQLGSVEINLPGVANNEAQDMKKLHQQLRLQRARNVRIHKLPATSTTNTAIVSNSDGTVSAIRKQGLLRRGDIIYRLLSQATLQL